jgi:hypothetical protein
LGQVTAGASVARGAAAGASGAGTGGQLRRIETAMRLCEISNLRKAEAA